MLDLIRRQLAAFNAGDWTTLAALLDEDVVYDEKGTSLRCEGRDETLEAMQNWRRAFPDAKGTVTNAYIGEDNVILELVWEGTHRGVLEGVLGKISPTGRGGKLQACEIFTVRGDKIVEIHHYFDQLSILAQLNVLPRLTAAVAEAHASP
jgi:steroid delta-isomerase-like uncharacterized protein